LEIFGKNGTTSKLSLNNNASLDKRVNLFERGRTDIFEMEAKNVGKVNSSFMKICYFSLKIYNKIVITIGFNFK